MTGEAKPVHAMRLVLHDSKGRRYIVEHAGAWDPPEDELNARSGCYYEDDDIPKGAISLYRVSRVVPQTSPCPLRAMTYTPTRARCGACGMTWIMAGNGWQIVGRTTQ